MRLSVSDRFLAKIVASPNGCWIWQAAIKSDGYGVFWVNGRTVRAHRFAYEMFVGPIPDGLQTDHLCRNRNCVNPAHLEPVTNQENFRRGEGGKHKRDKTHCPQGHPYAGENLYVKPNGYRECRICQRTRSLAYYHARKAQATG